jgi:hypothetical protein
MTGDIDQFYEHPALNLRDIRHHHIELQRSDDEREQRTNHSTEQL